MLERKIIMIGKTISNYKILEKLGIGGKSVLPEMWLLVKSLINNFLVVSSREVAAALRHLVELNRVIVEGAGTASIAAALAGMAGNGKVVCVVWNGNIDFYKLAKLTCGVKSYLKRD